jgi:hypothetical protein
MGDPVERRNWLALIISVSSVVGIVLALLGYGVSMAVQERFGLPHSIIYVSSTDLLNLGGWAVAQIITTAAQNFFSWAGLNALWMKLWPAAFLNYGLSICIAFAFIALWLFFRRLKSALRVQNSGVKHFRLLVIDHPWLSTAIAVFATAITTVFGTPLIFAFAAFIVFLICALLSVVPMIGMLAGESYIDDWVVRPTVCVTPMNREARMSKVEKSSPSGALKLHAANCVSVSRAKEEVDKGRLVFATPATIVLYDPRTGDARRISTDGATIKVIGEL